MVSIKNWGSKVLNFNYYQLDRPTNLFLIYYLNDFKLALVDNFQKSFILPLRGNSLLNHSYYFLYIIYSFQNSFLTQLKFKGISNNLKNY
jgi:hypothetical protein